MSDARRELMRLDADLRDRILIAAKSQHGDNFLVDPIEQDPVIRRKVRQAGKRAERTVTQMGMGRRHAIWDEQARILREEHGIQWFSPSDMNPHMLIN
jgi:hypothetical protein